VEEFEPLVHAHNRMQTHEMKFICITGFIKIGSRYSEVDEEVYTVNSDSFPKEL
jgi:hypothetical protein